MLGATSSADLPSTLGVFQANNAGLTNAFVAKLRRGGRQPQRRAE
jgi:hypothetical protein